MHLKGFCGHKLTLFIKKNLLIRRPCEYIIKNIKDIIFTLILLEKQPSVYLQIITHTHTKYFFREIC